MALVHRVEGLQIIDIRGRGRPLKMSREGIKKDVIDNGEVEYNYDRSNGEVELDKPTLDRWDCGI